MLAQATKRKLQALQKKQNKQLPTTSVSESSPNQSPVLKLIAEVEELLSKDIPQAVYKPAPHVTVLDVAHCLRSHLNHVKNNHHLESCKPYINRLIHLKNYVIRITGQ